MYVKPQTPYCGFSTRTVAGSKRLYVPRTKPHVLISAPTETGKTRRLLAPATVLWGGPAVVVSSKDDLMQYVMERRFGPMAVIDMRPVKAPVYPAGVRSLMYDPTTSITSPVEAQTVAENIMQMATVGLGSGADQVSDGGIWESQAAGPLAAFLYAASPAAARDGVGLGMDWVLRAVDNIDPEKVSEPGWAQAAARCHKYEVLALSMMRTLDMEPRQRDSIAITMRKAITPWLRTSLAAATAQAGGVVPTSFTSDTFDPAFLDDPQATLFVLAPADGTVAGAAVTLLESLVRRWRDKTAAREQMHRLLMVVDELPNTAPIPSLRRIVGEGRGLGLNLVAAVQDSEQLETVYGSAYATELRKIFPAALIMYGAHEVKLLEAAEDWSLLTTRHPETFSQHDGHKSLSSELGAGLRWQELLPANEETARLLIRGGLGRMVEIPDWTIFKRHYDAAVKARLQQAPEATGRQSAIGVGRGLLQKWRG
ncbi:type IV secretory system conjugative DNA transfer family protein [Mycolicibacterium goodii]|uniref:type IV secretory system conjugative DNA transfer family protein n=1 Tax=Mycolicibacterium goodii TaxID=134601 RepID=UPI001BDD0FB4|nr:type IV secretory system conjugative DNA transfer family protein [Mycolicibacterium goodii]MBU8819260.1 type IV secretory system conjugative DNA transfer family protein [Mycolicibacterium goodii]